MEILGLTQSNDDEFNQFINDDVPENVYSPYGDKKHDDNYYTLSDIDEFIEAPANNDRDQEDIFDGYIGY